VLSDLSVTDRRARLYVKPREAPEDDIGFPVYYEAVERLTPIVASPEAAEYLTGFYISLGKDYSLRLSYFASHADEATLWLERQFLRHGLSIVDRDSPENADFGDYHDGGLTRGNLQFRHFLHRYTQIGLELLASDRTASRELAATYRLRIAPEVYSGRLSARAHLLGAFETTRTYRGLPECAQAQLWDDFDYWHKRMDRGDPSCQDWAHLFVNMVLPGDWMVLSKCRHLFHPPIRLREDTEDCLCGQWGIKLAKR